VSTVNWLSGGLEMLPVVSNKIVLSGDCVVGLVRDVEVVSTIAGI